MKDEFDGVTPDMFDRKLTKVVSKPDMTARVNDLQAKIDKGTPITKDQHALVEKYGRGSGGGGGGGAGIPKVGPKKPMEMKSGGKVSSASKRADGCAIRGKTRA
jgi:hypothetical protein